MNCINCGNLIKPGKKFCTKCGTSVSDKILSVSIDSEKELSVAEVIEAQPAIESSKQESKLTCYQCGNLIKPGKKFCAKCGTPISDKIQTLQIDSEIEPSVAEVIEGKPKLESSKEESPLTCRQCGNLIKPGKKFCIKCGTSVSDEISSTSTISRIEPQVVKVIEVLPEIEPSTEEVIEIQHETESPLTCQQCGNMIKPGKKFCTKCGIPLSDNIPSTLNDFITESSVADGIKAQPAVEQPKEELNLACHQCGNNIKPIDKFCSKCGIPLIDKNNLDKAQDMLKLVTELNIERNNLQILNSKNLYHTLTKFNFNEDPNFLIQENFRPAFVKLAAILNSLNFTIIPGLCTPSKIIAQNTYQSLYSGIFWIIITLDKKINSEMIQVHISVKNSLNSKSREGFNAVKNTIVSLISQNINLVEVNEDITS